MLIPLQPSPASHYPAPLVPLPLICSSNYRIPHVTLPLSLASSFTPIPRIPLTHLPCVNVPNSARFITPTPLVHCPNSSGLITTPSRHVAPILLGPFYSYSSRPITPSPLGQCPHSARFSTPTPFVPLSPFFLSHYHIRHVTVPLSLPVRFTSILRLPFPHSLLVIVPIQFVSLHLSLAFYYPIPLVSLSPVCRFHKNYTSRPISPTSFVVPLFPFCAFHNKQP